MQIVEALQLIEEEEGIKDQYEMAAVLNVSQGTVSNYHKKDKYPTLTVAARIYGKWGHQVEPFTEKALAKEWDYIKQFED